MNLLKKVTVELWVLFLVALMFFIILMGFGSLVVHKILAPTNKFPLMSEIAYFISEVPSNFRDIIKGKSFKDLQVEDRFESLSGFEGEPHKDESYLILSKYDGDNEKSIVELVDLRSFKVIKTWEPDIEEINALVDTSQPEFKYLHRDKYSRRYSIKHPFLTEDGGLIFKDGSPLVKIDTDSNLVWQNQDDIFHHSVEQDHEGNLWIPTSVYPYQADSQFLGYDYRYKDDAITKVNLDGEIIFQKSITQLFLENNLEFLLFPLIDVVSNDPIHLNDIQPVLDDGPYWKKGDVFLSLRGLSMIILYRPSTNQIIWKSLGLSKAQHDVDILDDKRISIFNNNSFLTYNGRHVDGNNEIIIYDFSTKTSTKYFDQSMKAFDVRTINQGLSEIFDNGELFVEEQNFGRLLYFNKDESLKWQYINRADNGNVYFLSWSRILNKASDITKVRKIIKMGGFL